MALNRNRLILAKIESTYGTDPTPAGTDAVLVDIDLSINPVDEAVSRTFIDSTMGSNGSIITSQHVQVSFSVELAGAGSSAVTAGTAPAYDALLRACGFSSTSTATQDTVYAPVSSSHESITIYAQEDGEQQIITGCRGTVSFDLSARQLPMMRFSFTGLYGAPTTTANATPTLTDYQKPLSISYANTPTMTLHGQACNTESISIDVGGNTPYRNLINLENVPYYDRAVTGNMTIDRVALATKNYYTAITNNTQDAFQLIHGNSTGEIVQIDAPKVQINSLSKGGDASGELTHSFGLDFAKNSGNDELTITVK